MSADLPRCQLYGDAPKKLMHSALALALISIMLSGTGCMAWRAHGGEGIVPPNIRNSSGEHLRITRTDSSKIKLRRVAVSQDTLFGTTLGILGKRVAIPLGEITKVERQEFTKSSLAATVGLAGLGFGLLYYFVSD